VEVAWDVSQPPSPPPPRGASWVEEIRRASERIQALAQGTSPAANGEAAPSRPAALFGDLGSAVELLKRERYEDALAVIHGLPAEDARDPDVLLLRATLLTHGGRLGEAERVCAQLLSLDEMNAGAHYLLALCREGRGEPAGARSHDQVAAYLDPGFAMPRLHLGLLARRAGDRETARRELAQALELLRREESARLLLFGGGFSRDALIALCRAELVVCGGGG
jgi:chemotaxis protein methyltransferase CheR